MIKEEHYYLLKKIAQNALSAMLCQDYDGEIGDIDGICEYLGVSEEELINLGLIEKEGF